jgi:hypothetical protein
MNAPDSAPSAQDAGRDRSLRKAVLAGAAAVVLVGVAALAAAEIANAHRLDVRLPDGSVAQIRYVGDTPPAVDFAPAPMAPAILSPASDPFALESRFEALDRISEAMDRQADAMLQAVAAPPAPMLFGPGLTPVDVGKLPPGAYGVSMVSTISANGACTRSVQYQSLGDGQPPRVVTRTSGACPAAHATPPAPSVTAGSTARTSRPEHAGRQAV